jgi:hypothetical protein
MAMPETAVDKDRDPSPWEDDIGSAREIGPVQPKPDSQAMQR